MCEPISWIETDDGKIYYNTDVENEILAKDLKSWHNLEGHEAVEKFWKVRGKHLQCPVEADTDKIPEEIWQALCAGKFNKTFKMNHYVLTARKENDKQLIHVKRYHANGQLCIECDYLDGKLHDHYVEYHDNGQLCIECDYLDGKLHGHYVEYHDNGQLCKECDYLDGKLHGHYVKYFNNGQLDTECDCIDGKLHGHYVKYFANGQLYTESDYIDGKRR